jgi:hypothetical protein
MKYSFFRIFLLFFLVKACLCPRIFAARDPAPKLTNLSFDSLKILFNDDLEPKSELLELLQLIGMPPLNQSEKSIIQINDWAQKHLLRCGERWHLQSNRFEPLKTPLLFLLNKLHFLSGRSPRFKNYQGAIVHGTTLSKMNLRVEYLIEQWKQGIRFESIYFLSGNRPLTAEEKMLLAEREKNSSLELPQTEAEMVQWVWDRSELPQSMRDATIELHFIQATIQTEGKRPTTEDTAKAWLALKPLAGYYLAITNAPYILRQDLIMRNLCPKSFIFDTVGYAMPDPDNIPILLDELARCIFQIYTQYYPNRLSTL